MVHATYFPPQCLHTRCALCLCFPTHPTRRDHVELFIGTPGGGRVDCEAAACAQATQPCPHSPCWQVGVRVCRKDLETVPAPFPVCLSSVLCHAKPWADILSLNPKAAPWGRDPFHPHFTD